MPIGLLWFVARVCGYLDLILFFALFVSCYSILFGASKRLILSLTYFSSDKNFLFPPCTLDIYFRDEPGGHWYKVNMRLVIVHMSDGYTQRHQDVLFHQENKVIQASTSVEMHSQHSLYPQPFALPINQPLTLSITHPSHQASSALGSS